MSEVFEKSRTEGNARLVLLSLADCCNDEGSCWPSMKKIAMKSNLSEAMTKKYINALSLVGVVKKDEREDNFGRQTSNLYTINCDKFGSDFITKETILQVTSPSRIWSWEGVTGVNGGGGNICEGGEGVTGVSLANMNRHKEPKSEPPKANGIKVIETKEDLDLHFPPIADAIDSRPPNSGQKHNKARNEIPPPKKPRAAKLADEAFIAQLREANPRVDFDAEMKKMDNWLLANTTRKKTRQFVCNWINRVVERLAPEEDWKPTTI